MLGTLFLGLTVWYLPGWMRSAEPRAEVMASVSNAFPRASVAFKSWDGDRLVWPHAVESADKEAWRFAFEIATLPPDVRKNLILVGHSLGGRITARVLAHLAAKNIKIRQGVLLAAAIPSTDADLGRMGGGSELPILAVRNPKDVTLSYIYATVGGERARAFGAVGSAEPLPNVQHCIVPRNITEEVAIDAKWAQVQFFKNVANHHELFYFEYLRRVLAGEDEGL